MLELDHPETRFALETVRQAMRLVQHVQSHLVTPALTKGDRSPVTVADFASQALVAARLAEAFPADLLVAEEDSAALRGSPDLLEQVTGFVKTSLPQADATRVAAWIDRGTSGLTRRFWVLDPIDGTKGFLRGDQYVVALALVEDGLVQLAVLGCPNLKDGRFPAPGGSGSLVAAARGQGSWAFAGDASLDAPASAQRLRVSERSNPAQARILRSFESGHTNVDQTDAFARLLGIQAEAVRMDSQAKYGVLAGGEGELMLRLLSPDKPDYREKIWDQAAGSLVVEEAGGQISDLDGRPLDFTAGRELRNNRGVLASNRLLHPAALEALRRVGA